ncbi:MAG: TonB family protein [Kordiimonadaceae bacterium]|nr:TonB family protein [Kordiimonadaceae bacterium]
MTRLLLITLVAITLAGGAAIADAPTRRDVQIAHKAYSEALKAGDRGEAWKQVQLTYDLAKQFHGPTHKVTGIAALNYGRMIYDSKKSVKILSEALAIYEKHYGEDSVDIIDPLMELATGKLKTKSTGSAKGLFKRALEIAEVQEGKRSRLVGSVNQEIGEAFATTTGSRGSLKYFETARDIFAKNDTIKDKAQLGIANFWIGKYYLSRRKNKPATKALLTSLNQLEAISPNSQVTLANHAFLISAYEDQGMREEATEHCLAIGRAKPFDPNQDYKPVYRTNPIYPSSANAAGKEGYAIVSLTVDEKGFVKEPKVIEWKGSRAFGREALVAANKFRYVPQFQNGEAIETSDVKYKFSFNLSQ